MLTPVFRYPDGKTPVLAPECKSLLINEKEVRFDITKGEPTLPIIKFGEIYHMGWDIPTRYCIDSIKQCWKDHAHGGNLLKTSERELLNVASEDKQEKLKIEKVLGVSELLPCPTCGQLTEKV